MSKIQDLNGLPLVVGVVRGSVYQKQFQQAGIPYDESASDVMALKKLTDGRIDILPAVLERILYRANVRGFQGHFRWFVMADRPGHEFHLCFSTQQPGADMLVEQFNTALQTLKEGGIYDAIHCKYQ